MFSVFFKLSINIPVQFLGAEISEKKSATNIDMSALSIVYRRSLPVTNGTLKLKIKIF